MTEIEFLPTVTSKTIYRHTKFHFSVGCIVTESYTQWHKSRNGVWYSIGLGVLVQASVDENLPRVSNFFHKL